MFVVDDVLADMLGEDLVEDVVDREAQALLVLQQLLHQEGVKVVRVHHVVPGKQHSQNSHRFRLRRIKDTNNILNQKDKSYPNILYEEDEISEYSM